jgi:hypothetical protein
MKQKKAGAKSGTKSSTKSRTKSGTKCGTKSVKPVSAKTARTTSTPSRISRYGIAMEKLIKSLPDDEVFSLMEISDKLKETCDAPGRARDWIKQFPGNYVQIAQQTTIVGTKKAIVAFCTHHKLNNPWLK